MFLVIQTTRHRAFFIDRVAEGPAAGGAADLHQASAGVRSTPYHAAMLVAYLTLVILLAEKLAILLDHGIEVLARRRRWGRSRWQSWCSRPRACPESRRRGRTAYSAR